MGNILDGLNREQKEAVIEPEGTLLVLAGAGCGKTKVLTTRIAQLVQSGVSPYEILAVTFTNKAAKEMVERLSKMVGEEKAKKMWVGTFHSICGRILRTDIDKYKDPDSGKKYDKSFVIYDETDSNAIIKNALKKLNLDEKVYIPKVVKAAISNAKNKMWDSYTYASRARDYRSQKYSEIYSEYQKQLQLNNALDFDDMLMLAVKLFEESDEVREKYHNRFKHILVDEFQDTNISQYQMINSIYTNAKTEDELNGRSLCVVGDVDQSIYSWRGADFRIILNFQSSFPKAKLVKLEQNYRSVETILTAANSIITNNTQRVSKNLYSNLGKGEMIQLFEAQDEADEASYIMQNIRRLLNETSIGHIALLYRTNSQSRALEEACIANGVPYKIVGGLKFYDRKEIKDIIAYLKLIYNSDDSQSLRRIINVPKRSIGDTTMQKLIKISIDSDMSIYKILADIDEYDDFSNGIKTKLKGFYGLIEDLKSKWEMLALPEFITTILDETGYLSELRSEDTPENEARIDNLQELINVAKDFEPLEEGNDLGEFLSQVSLVSDIDSYNDEAETLTLMTLHSAKGLEFDYVFLTGLEEGIFPHSRSQNSLTEMEEERRLMYVGVTRAKKRLFITHAKRRQMWGEYRYYNQSRFLEEIPQSVIESNISDAVSMSGSHRKTFNAAVDKMRSMPQRETSSGSIAPTNSFGRGFVAPQKRKAMVVKAQANIAKKAEKQAQDEEKIKKLLDDNPIKRMLEEKKAKERALEEEKAKKPQPEIKEFFQGDRVFHSKFGIGHIKDIKVLSGAKMYVVDFGLQGEKALDASFCNLKKF
ncbi:MAG: 3'-5' exonuclease [Candidatus Gastranaerophilales bacterium]|nr:3'-5' exonuclease [Candidatus Gastranaerophilales bacterium]